MSGFVYVLDFNKPDSKVVGKPRVDDDDNISFTIKIGRTNSLDVRYEHYMNMNIESNNPRILFLVKTNDCVGLEKLFHNKFKNGTLNDATRRELFSVTKKIETRDTLTEKCKKIIDESPFECEDCTDNFEHCFASKKIDEIKKNKTKSIHRHLIISCSSKLHSNTKQRIIERCNLFNEKNISIYKFFKNKKYLSEPDGKFFGGSENKPDKYKPEDLYYDLLNNNLELVEPDINEVELSSLFTNSSDNTCVNENVVENFDEEDNEFFDAEDDAEDNTYDNENAVENSDTEDDENSDSETD